MGGEFAVRGRFLPLLRRQDLPRIDAHAGQFGNQFRLDLLDFQEPMPLVIDQLIHLPVQVADLELGLQIDLVVVLGPQPILDFLPILTHMMT